MVSNAALKKTIRQESRGTNSSIPSTPPPSTSQIYDAQGRSTAGGTQSSGLMGAEGKASVVTTSPRRDTSEKPTWIQQQCQGLSAMFFTWLNLLLVFVPLGIAAGELEWSHSAKFGCNFMAIVPLAGILGHATEALAAHTGQMIGGLLNATFGNAVEMIVTVNAIRAGLVGVVQGSLIGSILSNLLLVLGMAFVASGFVSKEAGFNQLGAGTNITCLVLASLALTLPTVYTYVPGTEVEDSILMSRLCALVMAGIYCLFLVFQLKTHSDMFSAEEEEEEADLDARVAALVLFGCTCCVAVCSEILVDSIDGVTEEYGLPKSFIGMILLPIVGNAAEHTTAVTVALKGKMDLTIGVAVGSSTQIALFVVPFSVIVGWITGVPMSLDFHIFMASVFVLSVFIASSVLADGSCNWFEGSMLVATYILVAIITWFIPDDAPEMHMNRELRAASLSGVVDEAAGHLVRLASEPSSIFV